MTEDMELVEMPVDQIIPYENNPRINDNAVQAVAESIRQCKYVAPIIVDENNVILKRYNRQGYSVHNSRSVREETPLFREGCK